MTRVLLVEDEEDLRLLSRMTLDRAGFETVEAASGTEALAALNHSPVDVVMLDLRIPPPDGWEVLAWIRETGLQARVRVVIVSAFVDGATAARAEAMGCRYLPKPFHPEDLISAIRGEELLGLR